jgi:hypothetical protein
MKNDKCETCGALATRFYRTRRKAQNGANSHMIYDYHSSCESCFIKMIYGKNNKKEGKE